MACLSLITSEFGLKFENLYLYCKTLDQDKYVYLKEVMKPIKEIRFFTFSTNDTILSPDEMRPNSLVIFDDCMNDSLVNRTSIKNIYTLGRHKNIDCLYCLQSYTRASKHTVREQSNFLCIWPQDILNLTHIYNDMCISADMKFDQFQQFCKECWKQKYDFACISLEHPKENGRYRRNFGEYLRL